MGARLAPRARIEGSEYLLMLQTWKEEEAEERRAWREKGTGVGIQSAQGSCDTIAEMRLRNMGQLLSHS